METIKLLGAFVKNKKCYYGVRVESFKSLINIMNKYVSTERYSNMCDIYPVELYKMSFGIKNDNDLNHPCIFNQVSDYFLRVQMIKAFKKIGPPRGSSTTIEYLINTKNMLYRILKARTNISNMFLDCCYRSQILSSLGHLLVTLKMKGKI